jgi:hypothetical protein
MKKKAKPSACHLSLMLLFRHFSRRIFNLNRRCAIMNSNNFKEQCADLTQELKIHIPCRLAERIEAFASKNGSTITAVVIEALDIFLREQNQA